MNETSLMDLRQEIGGLVSRVILEGNGREVLVPQDVRLVQQGYLDSISFVNLILIIQEKYNISIDISDLQEDNFGSVSEISNFVLMSKRSQEDPTGKDRFGEN